MVEITPISLGFIVDIPILNGGYKLTYDWGGATLKDSRIGSPGSPAGGGEVGGVCVTGQRGPRCQMGGGEMSAVPKGYLRIQWLVNVDHHFSYEKYHVSHVVVTHHLNNGI